MNDDSLPHGIYPMLFAFFTARGGLDRARIFDLLREGAETHAEALYREVLPAIVFVMQSLGTLHTYGKRIAAMRLGLGEVFDRAPALAPNAFGMRCAQRYAATLGPLE